MSSKKHKKGKLLVKKALKEKILDTGFQSWRLVFFFLLSGDASINTDEIIEKLDISESTLERRIKELREDPDFRVYREKGELVVLIDGDLAEFQRPKDNFDLSALSKETRRALYHYHLPRGEVKKIAGKAGVSSQMIGQVLGGTSNSRRVEEIIADYLGVERSFLWD